MGLHQTKELLHIKGNHQQNEKKKTYWMGEDVYKRCVQEGMNIQTI